MYTVHVSTGHCMLLHAGLNHAYHEHHYILAVTLGVTQPVFALLLFLSLFYQKIPLGELFSKTIFKSSRESPVWRKMEKFKI